MSTLDNLKKEAKRWLKALRAGDVSARARYVRAYPNGPGEPGLRDLQHALAREHGQNDWKTLTAAVVAAGAPKTPLQELLHAADRQDAARVAEVLAAHPDLVNRRGHLPGHTGLRTALHFGVHNEAVVRTLLDGGADPNIRDEGDNAIPLHFAAEREDLPIIRLLVEHGSDVIGHGDGHELDVIGWATCFGNAREDVVEYLLAHGAKHNIFSAVATNDLDAIRALAADSPAVIDTPMDATNRRRRPLHLAVVRSKPEALAVLLELGADVEARDEAGLTPLDQAAMSGELAMAERLISRGARVDLPAAIGLQRQADIERLLREDPDCLKPGHRWGTLIVTAAEKASGAIMETLIRAGASVNVKADPRTAVDEAEGYTALHAAAWHGNRPAVEVLLNHGADITAKDSKYDATPAGWADYAGHHEIRDVILGQSPDVTDRSRYQAPVEGGLPMTAPIVYPPAEPADVPIEMRSGFLQRLRDNSAVPTAEIWTLLMACRDGDLARVEALLTAWPTAVVAAYNYMTPIHLAVREGHTEIVRHLAERGAVNPKYRTYPYNEPLRTIAVDRGYTAIAAMLDEYSRNVDPDRPEEEGGHIEYVTDIERDRFQQLVTSNALGDVEEMLERRAELATDPFAFFSEGVLSMPANRRDREMIDLLMRFGARVPAMTKWAAEYYFKHDDIAALLLERGMSASHANCHRTTLLHEMARRGAIVRARLLLEHGAEIDAVDQEFKSTPLGFAARWGQRAMVRFLLDRGADRRRAGADWATPAAWARGKGHHLIAADLGV